MQKFKNDQTIFGSELFTSNSLVFEPNLHIPAPAGYILGPDDEIVVSVYGYSEKIQSYSKRAGEIYIPNVGPILLSGLSMEQAEEKIKSGLASTILQGYKFREPEQSTNFSWKNQSIRATVIGRAKKHGTFTVSLTTFFIIFSIYVVGLLL